MGNQKEIIVWWNSIDKDLKCVLKNAVNIKVKPTIDDIIKMTNLESINAQHFDLVNISPLFRLTKIKQAIFNNTSIESLECFKNSNNLEELDITFSLVKTLKPIWNLKNLKILKCKRTPKLMYEEVKQFVDSHPHCKVFWDYETDQHWLDFINLDQQEGTNQDPDDTTSKSTQYENIKISKLETLIENKVRQIIKENETENLKKFKLSRGFTIKDFEGEGLPNIGQFNKEDLKILEKLVKIGIFGKYRGSWTHSLSRLVPLKTIYYLKK